MTIRTLRWISVIVPTTFVVVFEIITRSLYNDSIPSWTHAMVALGAVLAGAFVFSTFVFATITSLEKEVTERNHRLAVLNALAAEVSESLDVEQVAAAATRKALTAMNAEAAGLALVAEDDRGLQLVSQDGLPVARITENGFRPLGEYDCECRKAVALGRPVVVEDTRESASCVGLLGEEKTRTCIAVPVKSKGRTTGALFLVRELSAPFAHDEVELIAAAGSQVGTVLENAQLFSKTEALAVLQERERVAREVHDGQAQTLGYLNVQMGVLDHLLATGEYAKMPVCDGIQATRLIKAELPETKIIMLTVSEDEDDLFEAISSGAHGYLLKDMRPEELLERLDEALRGEAVIATLMAQRILAAFVEQAHRTAARGQTEVKLSPREEEVLNLASQGATNKEIADRLFISVGTVKNHIHNILEKLHLTNRAQIAAYARVHRVTGWQ